MRDQVGPRPKQALHRSPAGSKAPKHEATKRGTSRPADSCVLVCRINSHGPGMEFFRLLSCGCHAVHGKALGLLLIAATAVIWVASSFISEALVSNKGDTKRAWHVPPFILTYLSTSLFTMFLPGVHLKLWLKRLWADRWVHVEESRM